MDPAIAALWKKLNLKDGMAVAVEDRHGALAAAVTELRATREVAPAPGPDTAFLLAFASTLPEVQAFAEQARGLAHEDPVVWIAYPKGSSRYRCEFNRDTGWESLGAAGFEPVRQVAIDADWSALRFRRVGNIASMTRSFALTDAGREKAARGRTAQRPAQ
jgi:hypothetical protein